MLATRGALVILLLAALFTLHGCHEKPEDLRAAAEFTNVFAVVSTVLFGIAVVAAIVVAACADEDSGTCPFCGCCGISVIFFVCGLSSWIAYAAYSSEMTCDTLFIMQPDLCLDGWLPAAQGFGVEECCIAATTTTMTTTSSGTVSTRTVTSKTATTSTASSMTLSSLTTTVSFTTTRTSTTTSTSTLVATPYCKCTAGGSKDLQCETGFGTSCDSDTDLGICFEEGRLCEVDSSMGCITRPEFETECSTFRMQEACEAQAHCYYQAPSLKFRMVCRSTGPDSNNTYANTVCANYTDQGRELCNNQKSCHWTIEQYDDQPCKNNGLHVGCVGLEKQLDRGCAIYDNNASCQTADLFGRCEWRGLCDCPTEYFWEDCGKEVVQFKPEGTCNQTVSDSAVCKGLVVAASSEDPRRCSEAQSCTTWDTVKSLVGQMREVEIGDMIVDAIALVFMGVFVIMVEFLPGNFERTYIFLATLVSFFADIVLEVFLLIYVSKASKEVEKLSGADCFSTNSDASRLLVKLSEVAESSLRLAFGQVGLAVVGTAFEIYEFFKDYNSLGSPQRPSQEKQPDAAVDQKEEPDDSKKCLHGSKLVRQASTWNFYRLCRVLGIVGMLFGELALGLWNYFQNTDVLLEGIQRIELSALQLKPMKDGHACYVRHPDLPPTTPSGVGWPNPILNMVVAGLVVLLFYLIAVAVTWCRRHGKDMGDQAQDDPPPPPPEAPCAFGACHQALGEINVIWTIPSLACPHGMLPAGAVGAAPPGATGLWHSRDQTSCEAVRTCACSGQSPHPGPQLHVNPGRAVAVHAVPMPPQAHAAPSLLSWPQLYGSRVVVPVTLHEAQQTWMHA